MKPLSIVLTFTLFVGIVFAVELTACGPANRLVVLQNPETKQTVQCRVDPWGSFNHTSQIENCVTAYKKAGYRVVGDSEP
jgi:hypothetical protein